MVVGHFAGGNCTATARGVGLAPEPAPQVVIEFHVTAPGTGLAGQLAKGIVVVLPGSHVGVVHLGLSSDIGTNPSRILFRPLMIP